MQDGGEEEALGATAVVADAGTLKLGNALFRNAEAVFHRMVYVISEHRLNVDLNQVLVMPRPTSRLLTSMFAT